MPYAAGIALALATAAISGLSIFVNAYGVREFPDPTQFATLKNTLVALALLGLVLRSGLHHEWWRLRTGHRAGLVLLGILGGSVPFVLFFEGLARVASGNAAFIHKTMFLWVAVLAVLLLRERLGRGQVLGLAALAGATLLMGGPGALEVGSGAALVLLATLAWSLEVVLAKRLLAEVSSTLAAAARMGFGALILLTYASAQGELGRLVQLSMAQWAWVVGTAILLLAYVLTWYAALQRAPATTVTCVLTLGAPLTALLAGLAGRPGPAPEQLVGQVLLVVAVVAIVLFTSRSPAPDAARTPSAAGAI